MRIRDLQAIPSGLHRKLLEFRDRLNHIAVTAETVRWGYRLYLDREPESWLVLAEKARRLATSRELRQDFFNSDEFKRKNPTLLRPPFSGDEPPMTIETADDLQDLFPHIQATWEGLGETEPYYSVVTIEQFKRAHIHESREDFYHSGRRNVATLFHTLERNGIDPASLKTCLEYGCGLGRVTRWLAERFEQVHGYDISRSHLRLAAQYLSDVGTQNVSLHHIDSPQAIRNLPKVDMVYSVIVLQHNPPPLIGWILREMMQALNSGGVAFFQVPTYRLGYRFDLREYLAHESRKREMEMHVLPQRTIFDIIRNANGRLIEVFEDDWTVWRYGERSNTFVVQKG